MLIFILSVLSGGLLSLSFPKAGLFWLAWLALVPWFYALAIAKNWRQAFFVGLIFSFTFFAFHFVWLLTLWRFVGPWVILGWFSLVVFQASFLILLSIVIYHLRRIQSRLFPLLVALAWVAFEWVRAWGPFGVTAGDLGYSQAPFLSLIQLAAWTTVYGVSFLVVFFNISLTDFLLDRCRWHFLFLAVILILANISWGGYVLVHQPELKDRTIRIALLQTNVDQIDRMDFSKLPAILTLHEEMTRLATKESPALIVWPETALFAYALNEPAIFSRLQVLARESRAWLIIGTPHYVPERQSYNSLAVISPKGEVVARYDKQHLVPFGEYLPFRSFLYPFLRSVGYYDAEFSLASSPKPLKFKGLNVAAVICFESIFPAVVKARISRETDFILLVTNDAWFADSSALYFHRDAGVFRAIENRKYFVQSSNTGITALIDPYGRVVAQLPPHERRILNVVVPISGKF